MKPDFNAEAQRRKGAENYEINETNDFLADADFDFESSRAV